MTGEREGYHLVDDGQDRVARELPSFSGPCPRCGGGVPSDRDRGEYPGALSRVDNKTYICSQCGTDEAMFNWSSPGVDLPPVERPVFVHKGDTVLRTQWKEST